MIKLEYELKQNQGENYSTYTVNENFEKIPNMCSIEGPNSSGKSTLLNIIALSFFGDEFEGVNHNLKNKIKDLVKPNKTEIKYKIEVDVDDKTKLIAEKKDFEKTNIEVYEVKEGKTYPLTYDNFKRKYLMIYDIPNNPTERIPELIKDVKIEHKDLQLEINKLKTKSIKMYEEITDKFNPERLKQLQENLKIAEEKYLEENEDLEIHKTKIEKLKKYTYYKYYEEYKEKFEYIKNQISDIEEKMRNDEYKRKTENKKYSKNLTEARESYNKLFGKIGEEYCKTLYEKLNNILEKDDEKLLTSLNYFIEKNKKPEWIINRSVDEEFEKMLEKIEIRIIELKDSLEKKENYKKASLIQELINILKRYEGTELNLPNYNQKDFVKELEKMDIENQKMNQEKQDYEYILGLIKSKIRYEIIVIKKKLKEVPKDYGTKEEEYIDPEEQIKKLIQAKENLEKKMDKYDKLYREVNSPKKEEYEKICNLFGEFRSFDEDKLNSMIDEAEKKLNKKINEVNGLDKTVFGLERDIKKLKDQEPHKYQNDLQLIIKINKVLSDKERHFIKYNDYIKNMEDKKHPSSEEEKMYGDLIFRYLGGRIGYFRDGDKEYYAEKVDIINEKIITDKKIDKYFSHMGTGQSQSAYLTGLLNIKTDKKIIVMFDEIAMMDKKSLEPIHNKMIEHYKNGKLIIGITVQRAEKISVEKIGG